MVAPMAGMAPHLSSPRAPTHVPSSIRIQMMDLVYVVMTLAFFAGMLAYVAGCERLGRAGATGEEKPQP